MLLAEGRNRGILAGVRESEIGAEKVLTTILKGTLSLA